MPDPLHILIVGHNLQAKCDVANAFIKQQNAFKQFRCHRNLLIKRMIGDRGATTVAGRSIDIILTPNINTPGWTHLNDGIINRYKTKVFVYVKAPGLVKVNDEESIKNIKKQFERTKVHIITYLENVTEADFETPKVPYIHKGMSLKQKKLTMDNVLKLIGNAFKTNFTGPYEVSNFSTKPSPKKRKEPSPSSEERQALDSATPFVRQNTDELELPKDVEAKHWDLLSRTLKCGRAKSNHVRVNIIGNQHAGKTTIVQRLHKVEVTCPNEKQQPTEALEISEISSRCIEINGEKCWETNQEGYTEDLNVQRMAQAMKSVQSVSDETAERKSLSIEEEDFEPDDYQLGSYVEDDIVVAAQDPYTAINKEQSRVRYMKQILRKINHSQEEKMFISYWDFAGQSTYYSTHQVFMSPSAVYVLVVDLSMDLTEKLSDSLNFRTGIIKDCSVAESLIFWVSSIKAFTTDTKGGKAPVVIVGTHVDKVRLIAEKKSSSVEEEINKKFDEVRQIIKMSEVECVAIDNTNPDTTVLDNLRNRILELGLGVIDEEIPAQWIDLERRIHEQKLKGTIFLSFEDLQHLDESTDVPMKDKTRLEAFLGHQHIRGHLIHFSHDDLKDFIILEPDILAKFLNNLMRSRDQKDQKYMEKHTGMYNLNGIINHNYIVEAAKNIGYKVMQENVDKLVSMLIHLSVIRPYRHDHNDTQYILPCLLPHRPTEATEKEKSSVVQTRNFQVEFQDNNMPPTFFHVLIGGLLNEWKLVERTLGKPEIFNLHARFHLETETQQMEIKWEGSKVYVDINNYSQKKTLSEGQIFDTLEIVERRIEEIFHVYRHTNRIYEIKVQCPEHKNAFVSLAKLRRHGEAMCYSKHEHAVDSDDVFGKNRIQKNTKAIFERKPKDADLGRLATYLVREDTSKLAIRLQIYQGQVEADHAAQISADESYRRLHILIRWRASNGSDSVNDLLYLLTANKDYQTDDLQNRLSSSPPKRSYDIPDAKLDFIPKNNVDLKIACNSIGALYPFLMLELGILFKDIQIAQTNNPQDMWQTIFTLLQIWRKENPKTSTTRMLLDTTSFVGIDTTEMLKGIWNN